MEVGEKPCYKISWNLQTHLNFFLKTSADINKIM